MDNKPLHFIRVKAGQQTYGLEMDWVRSILRIEHLQQELGDSGQVGWVSLSQQAVPVYLLGERLGVSTKPAHSNQRIVILNDPIRPWAILVEQVSQVMELPHSNVHLLPDVLGPAVRPMFSHVIRIQDELSLLLNPPGLHPNASPFWPELNPSEVTDTPSLKAVGSLSTKNGKGLQSRGRIVTFSLPYRANHQPELLFALSVMQVPEVLEPLDLLPVPAAPDYILGLANWRNQPIPVMDMACRLGLGRSQTGYVRWLIAQAAEQKFIAMLVRPGVQVLTLPIAHQPYKHSLPISTNWVLGSAQLATNVLVVPDLYSINHD